jgi:coenzyme F420-dependent glucose-6-phosphate dehydrogenase
MSDDPGAAAVRLGWWLSSEEHDPRDLVGHAVRAEAAGFTTAMISDHLQPWTRHQGSSPHVWTVIGAIAGATDTLQVGTGVTAMVHRNHPINVAQAAATAAVMCEGRFFLGVGTGERLNEQAFGERWSHITERRDQLEEAVEVVRALWSGSVTNHRGSQWSVENLQLSTRPAAPPPIYMATSGVRSASLAGRVADGIIGVAPDQRLVETFRASGGEGKPAIGQLHISIAATIDEAIDNAWEWWPQGVVPPTLLTELARPVHFEAASDAVGRGSITDAVVCTTDADRVVAAIDRFVGAGFGVVHLHQVGPDQDRLLQLASTELLPHYASGRRS